MPEKPVIICTRGSALALAQANMVLAQCRAAFPELAFELKVMKTTGDKLLTASLANPSADLPKGLFTKELEVALLEQRADLAVHSLKDLPTELPPGLTLGAVGERADVRDVLIYRDAAAALPPGLRGFPAGLTLAALPPNAVVATSSTRRKAQLLDQRPDLKFVEVRGNIITRMQKLAMQPGFDAMLLALAGLNRLHCQVTPEGRLQGESVPAGLRAVVLPADVMLPCVGQAALGIEIRASDARIAAVCARLNHSPTQQCVTAERAFLAAMGGGCASPVGVTTEIVGNQLRLRVVSFVGGTCRRATGERPVNEARELGESLAAQLRR